MSGGDAPRGAGSEEVARILAELARRRAGRPVEEELMAAKVADAFRDAGIRPIRTRVLFEKTAAMNEGDWRRLDLLARALPRPPLAAALARLGQGRNPVSVLVQALLVPARVHPDLDLELLSSDPASARALADSFLLGLGVHPRPAERAEESRELEALRGILREPG